MKTAVATRGMVPIGPDHAIITGKRNVRFLKMVIFIRAKDGIDIKIHRYKEDITALFAKWAKNLSLGPLPGLGSPTRGDELGAE